MDGWPDSQRHLAAPLRPYWSCRDELAVEDGLIMKDDRLVIPLSLQAEVLSKLHEAHQGIEKTRLRARSCVTFSKTFSQAAHLNGFPQISACIHTIKLNSVKTVLQVLFRLSQNILITPDWFPSLNELVFSYENDYFQK